MQAPIATAPTPPNERGTGGPGEAMPFGGFDPPESNFWRLPNNWFDLVAHFTSWAEHKVVEYVLRHTWGYQEYGVVKQITMDEFMHGRKRRDGSRLDAGCGMAENSIKKGINDAEAHGFLIVVVDDSDKGRIKKYFAPRMRRPLQDDGEHAAAPGGQPLMGQGQPLTPSPQSLTPGGRGLTPDPRTLTLDHQALPPTPRQLIPSRISVDPRTEQIPSERHSKKDTQSNNHLVVVRAGQTNTAHTASGDGAHHIATDSQAGPTPPSQTTPTRTRAPRTSVSDPRMPPVGPYAMPVIGPRPANPPSGADAAPVDRPAAEPAATPPAASGDLPARLIAEGVTAEKARSLVETLPAERIERQLAWIDGRNYQDRAATLVAAITRDYPAPVSRRPPSVEGAGYDRSKYFRGAYGVCPRCGSRPCVPGCGG